MTITPMGAAAGGSQGNNANLQLATITSVNLFTGEVICQIDGADTTCSVRSDAARRNFPATAGDRILVARQGSEMYEISCVQSAYAFFYPSAAYASYGLSADQSIAASTTTTVLFNTSLATRVIFAAPTSGVFTIPQSGLYSVTGRAVFATNATVTRRFAMLLINGNASERVEMSNGTVGPWTVQLQDVRPFVAGDTVAFQVFHSNATAINVTAFDTTGIVNSTLFRIAKVG